MPPNEAPLHLNGTHSRQKQVDAREAYFRLRDQLVVLQSALKPDSAAIDRLVKLLEQAQLHYKGTHGIIGNNPTD